MRRLIVAAVLIVAGAAGAMSVTAWVVLLSAQVPQAGPSSALLWTQPAPSLAAVQAYTFRYYADGATTGAVLAGVTCTAVAAVVTCEAPMPSTFTQGTHSIQITAGSVAGESGKSVPFTFDYVNAPGTPANVHLK